MRTVWILGTVLLLAGCAPTAPSTPSQNCLSAAQLNGYSYDHLARLASHLRDEKRSIEDFSGLIGAMKGSVNNYADVIESSTYLSNVVRALPIPYAGEVYGFTKIVGGTLLNLNTAAVALDRYQKSSSSFLAEFDKLDRSTATSAQLAKLSSYADTTFMSDAHELESALQKISASATALASAAQSVSNAMETTSGYLNQAKTLVGLKPATNDKSKAQSGRDTLNSRLAQLSQKISVLENSAQSHRRDIGKARTYAELSLQLK